MNARSVTRRRSLPLAFVLGATLMTLGLGLVLKAPCSGGNWADGRQYRALCYSDIVPLYGTERLGGSRLPYVDPCPNAAGQACDEYPPVTMYAMRFSAWISGGYTGFFYANAVVLTAAAIATSLVLYRLVGSAALYFALAPTLAIYAFMNWDLLAVVLATAATYAYARGRDAQSGALLGVGAATKFYPSLLLVPFSLGRVRHRRREAAALLVLAAAAAYAALNLPFAVFATDAWATFFRFNAERPADWDSLWFVVCDRLQRDVGCSWSPRLVNALSLVLFVFAAALVWRARRRRDPGFSRLTFGFPLLVVFLLTNKVYSPQYGLWLLPWFAISLPNPWLFGAFQAADVGVFITRFSWFGRLAGDAGDPAFADFAGVPLGAFQIALILRAAILVTCLAAWTAGEDRWRWGRVGASTFGWKRR